MTRYYFHLRWGRKIIRDLHGAEFDDLKCAESFAQAKYSEIAGAKVQSREQEVIVCDVRGTILAFFSARELGSRLPPPDNTNVDQDLRRNAQNENVGQFSL